MLNFDFHNPTHIAFGKGRIADLERLVPAQAKVLILVGAPAPRRPARWPRCGRRSGPGSTPRSRASSPTRATRPR